SPSPDLQVTSITIPAKVLSGDPLQVSWDVSNLGAGLAAGSWVDRVYLSADDQVGNDTLLGSFTHTGDLAGSEHYSRTETVTIPQRPDGAYRVVVITDADNAVYEDPKEGNNATVSQQSVAVVHPDLQVTALDVPANSISGAPILVRWTVANTGSGVTNAASWTDGIYVSQDATLDGSDSLLSDVARAGTL